MPAESDQTHLTVPAHNKMNVMVMHVSCLHVSCLSVARKVRHPTTMHRHPTTGVISIAASIGGFGNAVGNAMKDLGTGLEDDAGPGAVFYGRRRELRLLRDYCRAPPCEVLVLCGPRGVGKSALIRHALENDALFPPLEVLDGKHDGQALYIDGRGKPISSPSVFASTLWDEGRTWRGRVARAAQSALSMGPKAEVGLTGAKLSFDPAAVFANAMSPGTVRDVLRHYADSFQAWAEGGGVGSPVIAFDEAHQFMAWPPGPDLAALLNFFVAITTEVSSAHVLLISHDPAFLPWLRSSLGEDRFTARALGEFGIAAAREFLASRLARTGWPAPDDATWERVWAVAGGNAGRLSRIAAGLGLGDADSAAAAWARAVAPLARAAEESVFESLVGGELTGLYAAVAASLRAAAPPRHAVPYRTLVASLGAAGVDSLVSSGKVSLRLRGDWAHEGMDSSPESDPWCEEPPVGGEITAPSPSHWAAMEWALRDARGARAYTS